MLDAPLTRPLYHFLLFLFLTIHPSTQTAAAAALASLPLLQRLLNSIQYRHHQAARFGVGVVRDDNQARESRYSIGTLPKWSRWRRSRSPAASRRRSAVEASSTTSLPSTRLRSRGCTATATRAWPCSGRCRRWPGSMSCAVCPSQAGTSECCSDASPASPSHVSLQAPVR